MSEHEAIYQLLTEIRGDLGEIRGEMKALADLPTRVSALEQAKSWGHGAAATIAALVSFLGWLITSWRGPNAAP